MVKILDVCCGSKMFYFNKENKDVTFMDIRKESHILCDGREIKIIPDIVADFRNIPFKDEEFDHVVFDPPHLERVGESSWLFKKYGRLNCETWPQDIKTGFEECFRVLKVGGTLVFKWNEEQIKLKDVLNLTEYKPVYGNRKSKTHWLIFVKGVVV